MAVYRFLATPRWIGFAALMIFLSAVMVGLGWWQFDRYHMRHAINARIDQSAAAEPAPLSTVVTLDRPLPADRDWTRVRAAGVYDPAGTVVARGRTVSDQVGFEILTPLVLPDGSRLVVDRGWVPIGSARDADQPPRIPPAPTGEVTVEGRLHLPESSPDAPTKLGDVRAVRRIAPARLGMPATYVDYLLLDKQTPPSEAAFTSIPADRQPSWMNAGYSVQWWIFSVLALVGFGWAARREAHERRLGAAGPRQDGPDHAGVTRDRGDRGGRYRDRLGEDPTGGAPLGPSPRAP